MMVALASSLATVVLGFALGVAIARFRFPGRSLLTAVAIAPMVIPYLALAVALLMTFLAIGLRPSMATVILGHIVLAIPYVLLLIAARAVGLGTELEEAAMDLGGSWRTVLWRVYVPSLRPALLAAFASSFVLSLDEFYLAFFLAGPSQTLPVYFFSGLRRPELLPPTIALVTVVTAVTLTVLASVHVLTLRRGT
jgi:spermidine/putrescine transport system permease protein